MKKLSGTATCPKDGKFAWRGYHINKGEYISLNWDRDVQNFEHIMDDGTATVVCPICKDRISVRVNIK